MAEGLSHEVRAANPGLLAWESLVQVGSRAAEHPTSTPCLYPWTVELASHTSGCGMTNTEYLLSYVPGEGMGRQSPCPLRSSRWRSGSSREGNQAAQQVKLWGGMTPEVTVWLPRLHCRLLPSILLQGTNLCNPCMDPWKKQDHCPHFIDGQTESKRSSERFAWDRGTGRLPQSPSV